MAFEFDPSTATPFEDVTQKPAFDPGTAREADGALARGFRKSKQSIGITSDLATGDTAGAAEGIKEAADYAKANPGTKEGGELMEAWERGDGITGGIKEVAKEFGKDWNEADGAWEGVKSVGRNVEAMRQGVVEQIPNMLAPVAGMVGGGAAGSAVTPVVGTAVGAWAGASAGNALIEGGYMAQEALHEAGVDPQDLDAVKAYLDENRGTLLKQAGIKGGIIGAVDTATAGIAGRLLNAPARAATSRALSEMGINLADKAAVKAAQESTEFASRIANDSAYQASKAGVENIARNTAAALLDPAGEFAGEYLGSGVATGDWDEKNAALEALSSVGQSGAMFAGQKGYQYLTKPRSATGGNIATDTEVDATEAPAIDGLGSENSPGSIQAEEAQEEQTPSQKMGLNPADGVLSEAAAMAVDTGAAVVSPETVLEQGSAWNDLPQPEREVLLNQAGHWNAKNGGLNVLGKRLAAAEWDKIGDNDKARLNTAIEEARARSQEAEAQLQRREVGERLLGSVAQQLGDRPSALPAPDYSDFSAQIENLTKAIDRSRQSRIERDTTAIADIERSIRDLKKVNYTAPVDPSRDDLLTMIAKSGGISRAEAAQQGIDPTAFSLRKGIVPVFRENGGNTLDGMAETLSQYGLFSDGKYTANGLLDLMGNALAGNEVYAPAGLDRQAEVQELLRSQEDLKQHIADVEKNLGKLGEDEIYFAGELYRMMRQGATLDEVEAAIDAMDVDNGEFFENMAIISGAKNGQFRQETGQGEIEGNRQGNSEELSKGQEAGQETVTELLGENNANATNSGSQNSTGSATASQPDNSSMAGEQLQSSTEESAIDVEPELSSTPQAAMDRGGLGEEGAIASGQSKRSDSNSERPSGEELPGASAAISAQNTSENKNIQGSAANLTQDSPNVSQGGETLHTENTLRGQKIDKEFTAFSDDSGSLNIPRAEMPQVKAEHRGALANFLKGRGIAGEDKTVPASSLKPTQREFSEAKVQKAKDFTEGDRAILVSSDGHILDGHHQWMAKRDKGEDVRVIQLDAPIKQLLRAVKSFPSVEQADSVSAPIDQKPVAEKAPKPAAATQKELSTADSSTSQPSKIDDFGETIEGARKDYASKLSEAKEKNVAAVPMSESWPEPDYQALIDKGVSAEAVALARAIRDDMPVKPRKSWKLSGWAKTLEAKRAIAEDLISGNVSASDFRKEAENLKQAYSFFGRAELYQAVGHSKSLKGIELYQASFSMVGGVNYNPSKTLWVVDRKASATSLGNMPSTIARTETKEEAIAAFKKAYDSLDAITEKAGKAVRFDIYTDRKTNDAFIGKKVGRNVLRIKTGFASVQEARKYRDANQAELEKALDNIKDIPSERKETNAPRVGIDHRNGGDVTPDQFSEAFGFFGVQFGNYVENSRRQQDLNRAYDALMDLAGVLNIPPKALSLNGELGLAFGARGKGGKRAPAAHYESGTVVINLTKKEGAGSLAHEWWHSLDNYFSKSRGQKPSDTYATDSMTAKDIRPEMAEAFRGVKSAINRASLKSRSRKLDQTRTKPYWSTGIEMTARAFESYVIEKLKDQGASNDYLANIVSQEYWEAATALGIEKDNTYPYPEAAEMPEIRAAYDNFFNVIESRETDIGEGKKGVELFSRSQSTQNAHTIEELRTELNKVEKGVYSALENAGLARVITSEQLPANIKDGRLSKEQTQTEAFRKWFGDSKVVDEKGKPLVVYHGTDSVFTEFSRTGDIGHHFGTEIAARDRAARVGSTGVLVEPVTLSQVEKDSLAALNGEIGGTPAADLYALLLRKLDSPRQDLRAQVEAMPADEIKQVKAEYLEQPDSIRFAERVDRAKAGEGFRVEVNGETVSMHRTVREANARAARLREQAAKPMALYLRIENPIRLPDLGVWPAQEIAKEAGFSKQEMEQVVEAGTAEQQYAAVRAILEAKGFDGIVYRNEVEHAGEDSYIAFSPEQIKSAIGNQGTFDPNNPDIRYSSDGRVLAYVQDGKVTFVADNIPKGHNVKGLMLHEIGVHLKQLGKNDKDFQAILRRMEFARKAGNKKVQAAFDRVPKDTKPHLITEEAAGYLVESASDTNLAQQIITWIKAKLKEWVRTLAKGRDLLALTRWANNITQDELVMLATAGVKSVNNDAIAQNDLVMASRAAEDAATESSPIARFRTVNSGRKGSVSVADAAKAVDAITLKWSPLTKKRIKVVATFSDLPPDIQAKERAKGAKGDEKGIFHNADNVFVLTENHNSIADIEETVFHEAYGHLGFSGLFGNDITSAMNRLFLAIGGNGGIRKLANKYGVNLSQYQADFSRQVQDGKITKEQRDAIIMEELLAHLQQDQSPNIKRISMELWGKIRNWFRSFFPNLGRVTDSELFYLLRQSKEVVIKNKVSGDFYVSGRSMYKKQPSWYRSALSDTVSGMGKIADKSGMVHPNQAKLWLQSQQKKGAFKQEELEWVGLNEWLDMQAGKVAVSDIQGFVDAEGVQVEEVTLADEGYLLNSDGRRIDDGAGGFVKKGKDTKYTQYQLPGGENYREVLLTLPDKAEQERSAINDRFVVLADKIKAKYGERNVYDAKDKGLLSESEALELSDIDKAMASRKNRFEDNYKSQHWDQPNVVAHIRMNDRTDADGNRVLFIEEIQSDWAQEGRKKGFSGVKKTMDQNLSSIGGLLDGSGGGGVPNAPFVKDTKAWTALAMKRIIAMAAEGGYDKVAFINGEQSADRYDLSHQLEELKVFNHGDGNWDVSGIKKGGGLVDIASSISEEKLADTIGKDMAKKAIDDQKERGWKTYSGLDLRVGGEGMKAFYDQIVPQVARDVLKKVGGGKMEESTFFAPIDRKGEDFDAVSFAITDGIRQKVAEGLPLFRKDEASTGAQAKRSVGDPPKEEAVRVQSAIEGKTLVQAAEFLTQSPDGAKAAVAKKVMEKLQRLERAGVALDLKIVHRGDMAPADLANARGYTETGFDDKGRDITVWINGADVTGKVGVEEEVLLHELVHAATTGMVHYGATNPNTIAGKHARDLMAVTDAISDHITKRFAAADDGKATLTEFELDMREGANNAFRSDDEVLAWALSSREAQQYLETIPYRNETLWDGFARSVRILLGLEETNATALTEVLRVADRILTDDAPQSGRAAFWHKRNIRMVQQQGRGSIAHTANRAAGRSQRDYPFTLSGNNPSDTSKTGLDAQAILARNWNGNAEESVVAAIREAKAIADRDVADWLQTNKVRLESVGVPRFRSSAEDSATQRAKALGEAVKSVTVTDIKKSAHGKMTDFLKIGLQLLGRRQIVDVYSKMLPSLKSYDNLAAQMVADKNDGGAHADELARKWGKLDDQDKLADLMHDATLAGIDADIEVDAAQEADRMKLKMLRGRFQALSDDAKAVYREARNSYNNHYDQVREAIADRIMRSELRQEKKADLLKRMDGEFYKRTKGVYFPLARFGQYVVSVKDSSGKVVSISRAETMGEANSLRDSLKKQFGQGYEISKVTLDKEFVSSRDSVSRGFMSDLYGALDDLNMPARQLAELEDILGQLYLSSMPDLSWAKHGIHRKGAPGFSDDARRAFSQNMFHGVRYLAKLRYSDRMQAALDDMQKYADARKDDDGYDQPRAQRVIDEMVKRHDVIMNPKSNPVSTGLTSIGFLYYMGLSPASAIVNMSQTALVAYPIMGAKWGFDKAGAALLKASADTVKARNDLSKSLSGDELKAFEQAVSDGTIDVTQAHDLAGIAQGEDVGVIWKFRGVMRIASAMFHHAERFNRQATFLAAYRLAKETGANHANSFEQAKKATYDSHFDYSSDNRPRAMQGNVARVVLLFKQYAQNMIYTMARNTYQSFSDSSPEVKKEARRAIGAILASHAAAAGVLGLPLVGTILGIASAIGGDDDDPWNAEVALRNMLADVFGSKASEVIARGLSRATPFDISGRVSLEHLIFPDVREGLEGGDLAEAWSMAALGAVAGIGVNVARGAQYMADGDVGRGLETMLPVAIRNPIKALRYAEEGVIDRTGVVIKNDVDVFGVAGQAAGFSPSDVRLAYEGRSAIYDRDKSLGARRSELMAAYARAAIDADRDRMSEVRAEIAAFNRKNPGRAIRPNNLTQSIRNRRRRAAQAEDGIYLSRTRRDAMEAGRFAEND